jgi:hypothetical protein
MGRCRGEGSSAWSWMASRHVTTTSAARGGEGNAVAPREIGPEPRATNPRPAAPAGARCGWWVRRVPPPAGPGGRGHVRGVAVPGAGGAAGRCRPGRSGPRGLAYVEAHRWRRTARAWAVAVHPLTGRDFGLCRLADGFFLDMTLPVV